MAIDTTKDFVNDKVRLLRGDCVQRIKEIESDSIGYSIFSPPFSSLYVYSDHLEDMGNSKDYNEFYQHFKFLIKELHRIIMPGRLVSIHCMNLPISKQNFGYIGLHDFRGDLKESGVADKDYNVTLADGSKFNIGLDGKTKYKNLDEKTTRNAWDVDWSNPLAKLASDKIDPVIRNLYGADNAKAKYFPAQFTGMLVNAATSNAKNEQEVLANIETMLGKSKFAQQAGVGIKPPPPPKAPKGEVVRVSSGMYVNDKGEVKPAKTVKEALRINYQKEKENGTRK